MDIRDRQDPVRPESPEDTGSPRDPGTAAAIPFLNRLGHALHRYGTPAHRLEEALELTSRRLGVTGEFFATPTAIFASFTEGGRPIVHLIRVEPGSVDLGRTARLDRMIKDLEAHRLTIEEADQRLDRILDETSRVPDWLTILAFALSSGAAARFFGGGLRESLAASASGLLIGAFAVLSRRRPAIERLFEPLAAMAVSAFAVTMAALWSPLSASVTTLAGLIVLVPGLALTTAMTELTTRHLASGTARFAGAAVVFVTIGFGTALGMRLAGFVFPVPLDVVPMPLPGWSEALALLLALGAIGVLLRVERRSSGVVLAAGVLAYGGARLGGVLLGSELGAFLAAFALALGANGYARAGIGPASVPLVPGLLLLVPGSIGFRSVKALVMNDVVSGLATAFSMVLVAVAIVSGLLLANAVLPPKKAL